MCPRTAAHGSAPGVELLFEADQLPCSQGELLLIKVTTSQRALLAALVGCGRAEGGAIGLVGVIEVMHRR